MLLSRERRSALHWASVWVRVALSYRAPTAMLTCRKLLRLESERVEFPLWATANVLLNICAYTLERWQHVLNGVTQCRVFFFLGTGPFYYIPFKKCNIIAVFMRWFVLYSCRKPSQAILDVCWRFRNVSQAERGWVRDFVKGLNSRLCWFGCWN